MDERQVAALARKTRRMLVKTLRAIRHNTEAKTLLFWKLRESLWQYARGVSPDDAAAVIEETGGWPAGFGPCPLQWDAGAGAYLAVVPASAPAGALGGPESTS